VPGTPQSLTWPSNRAILLVHGVGNARPGDYTALLGHLRAALGPSAGQFAIYELYYNAINNWFKEKTALADRLQQARAVVKVGVGDPDLAHAVAEYAGDVLWPLFSRSARAAVREAYLAQLKQLVLDGMDAGVLRANQRISIVAHSLGCFYTYEVLHTAATRVSHRLMPRSHAVRFANVIVMAPPIQLIRTIGEAIGAAVPNRGELAVFDRGGLVLPAETRGNQKTLSTLNWISITGELDPVGGFFFRRRAPWAYTHIEGQLSIVDPQTALGIDSRDDLVATLRAGLSARTRPDISSGNPHSWEGYVVRQGAELARWLTA
jgi:hypothetical protein